MELEKMGYEVSAEVSQVVSKSSIKHLNWLIVHTLVSENFEGIVIF